MRRLLLQNPKERGVYAACFVFRFYIVCFKCIKDLLHTRVHAFIRFFTVMIITCELDIDQESWLYILLFGSNLHYRIFYLTDSNSLCSIVTHLQLFYHICNNEIRLDFFQIILTVQCGAISNV